MKHSTNDLIRATRQNQLENVRIMIDEGASIGMNEIGCTALHMAVQFGHIEIAKLLIEKGTDINAGAQYFGATPVHHAAFCNQFGCVKLLVEHGADINIQGYCGSTALLASISNLHNGSDEIATFLLDHGANPNLHVQGINYLIQVATWNHLWKTLMRLIKISIKQLCLSP